ncbi:hypothetical protein D1871_05810 [Nakamurella silvestris]|nr:hypothetical protein D1871_05810 [Nakamurella silvestris]
MSEQPSVPSRSIADAIKQSESRQLDALEDLVERVMDEVAAEAAGKPVDAVQEMLADRLRPHLPVDAKANKAWLRERARLIVGAAGPGGPTTPTV